MSSVSRWMATPSVVMKDCLQLLIFCSEILGCCNWGPETAANEPIHHVHGGEQRVNHSNHVCWNDGLQSYQNTGELWPRYCANQGYMHKFAIYFMSCLLQSLSSLKAVKLSIRNWSLFWQMLLWFVWLRTSVTLWACCHCINLTGLIS